MLVYIAILSIVVSAITLTAISMLNTFARLRASQDIAETGVVALERITREIRFANTVNIGASTLGSHPGVLVLSSVDESDNPIVLTFSVLNGRIIITKNGASSPLTRSTVTVSNLEFTYTPGTNSSAVLIECTLERDFKGTTISKDFRTFVVLKG
jgi:Tfp pilus assembly protein PilW